MYKLLISISVCVFLSSCLTQKGISTKSGVTPFQSNSFVGGLSTLKNAEEFVEYPKFEISPEPVNVELSEIDHINRIRYEELMKVLTAAESYLGTRYRYGGTSKRGIDCSSFVQHSFEHSLSLPRTAVLQAKQGIRVRRSELKKGDLVFFATRGRGRVSHVGIVHSIDEKGRVKFIHASSSQGVTITLLSNSYWSPRYLYGKRLFTDDFIKDKSFAGQQASNAETKKDSLDLNS